MKKIPLSENGKHKGKYSAIVDDEDYLLVVGFAPNGWEFKFTTGSNNPYAITRKTILADGKSVRKQYYLHRVVMRVLDNPKVHIDHKIDTLDCRKENLRICSRVQNMKNRSASKFGTSKYLGVHYCKHKRKRIWRANIKPENMGNIHLGYYDNEESAGYAYNLSAKIIHGEWARLNKLKTDICDLGIKKYVEIAIEKKMRKNKLEIN